MNKFVIASLNRKGNLVFVNRYYGGTAKTSENIELGLKDGNVPFIVSINQVMAKTI